MAPPLGTASTSIPATVQKGKSEARQLVQHLQVMHWDVTDAGLPGPDTLPTQWLRLPEQRLPDVLVLSGIRGRGELDAMYGAQWAPLGYRLMGSGDFGGPQGGQAILLRGGDQDGAAWTSSEGLQVQRESVRFGPDRVTLFAFQMPPDAKKPTKLAARIRDLVKAHRLKHPQDQIMVVGQLPTAFDPDTLGSKGLPTRTRPQDLKSPGHWFVANADGVSPSGPPKTLRLAHRMSVEKNTSDKLRSKLLLDPTFFSEERARYKSRSFQAWTGGPSSVSLSWDPNPPPPEKKLKAPGVRLPEAVQTSPKKAPPKASTKRSDPPPPLFDPAEPGSGPVTVRLPVQLTQKIKQEVRSRLAEATPTGTVTEQALRSALLGLGDVEIRGHEVDPVSSDAFEGLSHSALTEELKSRFTRTRRLGYELASRVMLQRLHNAAGRVTEPFSGQSYEHPRDRPEIRPKDLTVEHIWARHNGAREAIAIDDLHILLPMDAEMNSHRGHVPYGSLKPSDEVLWERDGNTLARRPDGSSVFQPSEAVRGRIARAMFYAAVLYDHALSSEQLATYTKWHAEYPPTQSERSLNGQISVFQGNRNPFIDAPELVGRWCQGYTGRKGLACPPH